MSVIKIQNLNQSKSVRPTYQVKGKIGYKSCIETCDIAPTWIVSHKFTSNVYREVAFSSISGSIGSDVAHVVNTGVQLLSRFLGKWVQNVELTFGLYRHLIAVNDCPFLSLKLIRARVTKSPLFKIYIYVLEFVRKPIIASLTLREDKKKIIQDTLFSLIPGL